MTPYRFYRADVRHWASALLTVLALVAVVGVTILLSVLIEAPK